MQQKLKIRLFSIILLVFGLGLSAPAQAQELVDVFNKTGANEKQIDYAPYREFLETYMKASNDGVNRFSYGNITAEGRGLLTTQLSILHGIRIIDYNKNIQLAYWINLYNIIVLHAVVKNYPIESIEDIPKVWKTDYVTVQGQKLSLDDIEHAIIRPIFKDWRIHAALNVAAISSGNIPFKPYGTNNLDYELNQTATQWLSHPRTFHGEGNTLRLSTVFKWYKEDFGDSREGLLSIIQQNLNDFAMIKFNTYKDKKIKYFFDWTLNDKKLP